MHTICQKADITPIWMTKRKIGSEKRKEMIIDVLVSFGFHALRHLMPSYLLDKEKVFLNNQQRLQIILIQ
jgi:hypothetical protein